MKAMRLLGVVVLVGLFVSSAFADGPHADLWDMYSGRDYDTAIDSAMVRLEVMPEDRDLSHLVGRCLFDAGRREEAVAYLQPLAEGEIRDWRYAWSLFYMGVLALDQGDDEAVKDAWREVRDAKITRNVARNAENNLRFFGLHEAFDEWERRRTEHCIFAFSPEHTEKDLEGYAESHERAYDKLAELFGGAPEVPVRYMVWASEEEANEMCGIESLGFARPSICLIHCLWPQTLAHELTHVMSFQALRPTAQTRLINEGLAICMDMTNRDRMALARHTVAEAGLTELNLTAWWNDDQVNEAVFYPVAGAWMTLLLERGGREKLLQLAADQTLDSARSIYGPDLDTYLADFTAGLFTDGTQ
jgi:hypothetical protein